MPRRPAVVAVLDLVTNADGLTVPEGLPSVADVIREGDDLLTIWPSGRVAHPDRFAHAILLGDNGTQGLWFIASDFGAIVNAAESRAGTRAWRSMAELRGDARPVALAAKAIVRDLRPRDAGGLPIGELVRVRRAVAGFADDDGEHVVVSVKPARGGE